jgi:hypothetical protein
MVRIPPLGSDDEARLDLGGFSDRGAQLREVRGGNAKRIKTGRLGEVTVLGPTCLRKTTEILARKPSPTNQRPGNCLLVNELVRFLTS